MCPLVHAVPRPRVVIQARPSCCLLALPTRPGNTLPRPTFLTKAVKPLKCARSKHQGLAHGTCKAGEPRPKSFSTRTPRPHFLIPQPHPGGSIPSSPGPATGPESAGAWALDHPCPGKQEACGAHVRGVAAPTLVLGLVVVAGLVGCHAGERTPPHRQVIAPHKSPRRRSRSRAAAPTAVWTATPPSLDVDPVCRGNSRMGRRPPLSCCSGAPCIPLHSTLPPPAGPLLSLLSCPLSTDADPHRQLPGQLQVSA